MKIAVIEYNTYHDEVLPTVVFALNRLGIEPDVYIPRRAIRRDAFALATDLRYRLKAIDGISRIRGTPSRYQHYDALVLNSVEPVSVLRSAARLNVPAIAIVHNADLITEHDEYRRFFSGTTRLPMFLGRHVASSVGLGHEDSWVSPVYFGEVPTHASSGDLWQLCVQGNVEFERRDYRGLVEAAAELAEERSDFVIRVVGRSNTPGGIALRNLVRVHGVDQHFAFSNEELSHRDYLSLVARCDLIMPLLASTNPLFAPYFSVKITMSMSMGVGLGVIPVAETGLADLYGARDASVTHEPDHVLDALRIAFALSPTARQDLVGRLAELRSAVLGSSVRNLSTLLSKLVTGWDRH